MAKTFEVSDNRFLAVVMFNEYTQEQVFSILDNAVPSGMFDDEDAIHQRKMDILEEMAHVKNIELNTKLQKLIDLEALVGSPAKYVPFDFLTMEGVVDLTPNGVPLNVTHFRGAMCGNSILYPILRLEALLDEEDYDFAIAE
jgi:hypothetical protein